MHPFFDILAVTLALGAILALGHLCLVEKQPPAAPATLALWIFGALAAGLAFCSIYQMSWFYPLTLFVNNKLSSSRLMQEPVIAKMSATQQHVIVSGLLCVPLLLVVASYTERA